MVENVSGEKGASSAQGLIIDQIGGKCPVQAEGTVDGHEFYFRSRGNHWSMSIGGADVVMDPLWYYEEPYGTGDFEAGWIEIEEARAFINKAVAFFRASDEPPQGGDAVAAPGRSPASAVGSAEAPAVHTFAINPEGGEDISVEGGTRFAHAAEVLAYMEWAKANLSRLTEENAALRAERDALKQTAERMAVLIAPFAAIADRLHAETPHEMVVTTIRGCALTHGHFRAARQALTPSEEPPHGR